MNQQNYTNEQLDLVKKINICQNYYEVLSVSRESSRSEIRKSYKKLALQVHPDKNHAPGAAEAFKTLGKAMSVLSDDQKRKEYDMTGPNHRHHQHCHGYYRGATFENFEDYTAEEMWRTYGTVYQRWPQVHRHHLQTMALGLLLVLIMVSQLLATILLTLFSPGSREQRNLRARRNSATYSWFWR